jgi:glycosyltransferase involved in cell wall biosynthesis
VVAAVPSRTQQVLYRLGAGWAQRRHRTRAEWHSWDPSPARHPWLTAENLTRIRAFSESLWHEAHAVSSRGAADPLRFAFVGNLANYLYKRAVPLRKRGWQVELVLHPDDDHVLSQPGWEEWDGELRTNARTVRELEAEGIRLASVADVVKPPKEFIAPASADRTEPYLRRHDLYRFPEYLAYAPVFRHLQHADAVLTAQAPYLAYLARRPYLAAQGGGDLWFDCSRDDVHGQLCRISFGSANAILASNPWTFAHARRFGMRNAIYLPYMLDDEAYSSGPPKYHAEWKERTGGRFFVLSTARFDERYKGSSVALEGFARFAAANPEARLIAIGWGDDADVQLGRLSELGIDTKVHVLPLAGKRRVVDYLRSSDCLLDQFALGAYGATALEAMGCGLPVVMRLELEQYRALCGSPPPVLNAEGPEEVAAALALLADDPDRRRRLAADHRAWFVANHGSSTWAGRYIDVLRATALGEEFDYADSPLTEPTSEEETEYYAAGLRSAPPFPHYH